MINQIRIYEIFDDTKQAFLDRFRDHAASIMKKYNFRMLAMWETVHNDKPAFAYLLSWNDEAEMNRLWEVFKADEEWLEVKRQTAPPPGVKIVGQIDDLVLAPTDFSAALS